jgi:hypothetical protein
MAFKICRPTLGTSPAFVQLDPLQGQANCQFVNAMGQVVRFVGPANNLAEAQALAANNVFFEIPSNASIVYSMNLDPSKTWFACVAGGGNLFVQMSW